MACPITDKNGRCISEAVSEAMGGAKGAVSDEDIKKMVPKKPLEPTPPAKRRTPLPPIPNPIKKTLDDLIRRRK